ncbi:MAG: hypothetical protein ACW98X_24550 [Promethearchaeota archaeon]
MGIGKIGEKMGKFENEVLTRLLAIESTLKKIEGRDKEKVAKVKTKQLKSYDSVMHKWNEFCENHPHYGLSKITAITAKRSSGIKQRLKEKKFDIDQLFEIIKLSSFLLGNNGSRWKVNFDFVFTSPHNWIKIFEGMYVDTHNKSKYYAIVNPPKKIRELFENREMLEKQFQNIGNML